MTKGWRTSPHFGLDEVVEMKGGSRVKVRGEAMLWAQRKLKGTGKGDEKGLLSGGTRFVSKKKERSTQQALEKLVQRKELAEGNVSKKKQRWAIPGAPIGRGTEDVIRNRKPGTTLCGDTVLLSSNST